MTTTSGNEAAPGTPTSPTPAPPAATATGTPGGSPTTDDRLRASQQDGTYPRPQLVREHWTSLDGTWSFAHDDGDVGLRDGWKDGTFPEPRSITVPFPPESTASGIGDPGYHPVVWYSRALDGSEFEASGHHLEERPRLLLHFGAVDHRAKVWLGGVFLGEHEGGHTPFTFDVTDVVASGMRDELAHANLVVRAEDDPHDVTQPRGKQEWRPEPHVIWYHRTTGIWQPVWLEALPATSIESVRWSTDLVAATVTARVRYAGPLGQEVAAVVMVTGPDGEELGGTLGGFDDTSHEVDVTVTLTRQRNGQAYEELVWSPERPVLLDARVVLVDAQWHEIDHVESYIGLRSVAVERGRFLLNDRPYDVRSVLEQGYWPQSHLAAPSAAALRREVELIKELGFNAARIHQKIEDPRFLFWADRLGLLIWGETPGAYEFSPIAVHRLTREWLEAVERDVSHPCIVTWVPFNESWGIQHVAHSPAQQAYSRALTDLTRALDPTRPVISNDGWEHSNSDILSVHDYEGDGTVMARTYADDAARARLLEGFGPAGRRILVGPATDRGQAVMLTEFGGVNFQPGAERDDAWGYTSATDGADWITRITALYDAVRASSFLAGSCYTQLTDTMQETNGLLTEDRVPKFPIAAIRRAVTGSTGR